MIDKTKVFTVDDIRSGIGVVLVSSQDGYVLSYHAVKGTYHAVDFETLEGYSLGRNIHKAAKRFTKLIQGTKPEDIRGVFPIKKTSK